MANLPANQTNGSALSSPERAAHREWIGGRAVTLLSHYWREDDPVELTAAIGKDWADVLEGIPQEFIQRACLQYLSDEPRRKPTPGEIRQRARKMMPAPKVVYREPDERPERVTPERAAEIMEQAGFKPRTFK